MSSSLSYFMILNESGLPYYSQSFKFKSTEVCRNFAGRKITKSDEEDFLRGAFFSAIQIYASAVLKSNLNLFDLNFQNFKIAGRLSRKIYFLAIYEIIETEEYEDSYKFLKTVSDKFLRIYNNDLDDLAMDLSKFQKFTDVILEELDNINDIEIKDCITGCSAKRQGCVPHDFFYNVLAENRQDLVVLALTNKDQIKE